MLQPRGKGLLATALRYRNEVRDEHQYFDDIPNIKVPAEMLDLAVHILESKAGHFDPSKFEDRYEQALAALIKAKRAGKPPPAPSEPPPGNVINLMDALRRSVQAERGGRSTARRHSGKARSSARKRPARRAGMKRAG
jgi:DNA end-binding protein Ku